MSDDSERLNEMMDSPPSTPNDDGDCMEVGQDGSDMTASDHPILASKARVVDVSFQQWSRVGANQFSPTGQTHTKLLPGVYRCFAAEMGPYLEKIDFETEGILRFPDSKTDEILEEIERFWDREEIFKQYGLLHKRGLLLFGPPAGGKTTTIMLACKGVVELGGVVIDFTTPELTALALRLIREIQPGTKVVVVMEDIDALITKQFGESPVLNLLDGIEKTNNVLFLATTNYPHLLGKRVVNRPSRFDRRIYVGFPNTESRKMFLEHLATRGGEFGIPEELDLGKWVEDTKDMSLAHCKALFESVVILGNSYDDVLADLTSMNEKDPHQEEDGSIPTGFASAVAETQDRRRKRLAGSAIPPRRLVGTQR